MKRVLVLRHAEDEPLGNLEIVLGACGLELEVVDCFAGQWRNVARRGFAPAAWMGFVVMGGPMNVDQTDRHPFLAAEVEWLRAAVDAHLPTLGICLGAQLLAKSLGAPVYSNPLKEIGWYEIELTEAARAAGLLAASRERETVFQWHADTFDLPAGAELLASSSTCRHQAFRHGPRAYGLQFHPEITEQMVSDWLAAPEMCAEATALSYIDPAEIRRRAPAAVAAMAPFTTNIFRRFASLCGESPGSVTEAQSSGRTR